MHKRGRGNIQERSPLVLEKSARKQDDTYLQNSANGTITCSQTPDDKQYVHDPPSKNRDFDMALTLFPEFLLQDTSKDWKHSSSDKEKGTMNSEKWLLNSSGTKHKITEHFKNSKDVVDWVRNEYGMNLGS